MPELPEVESVGGFLRRHAVGRRIERMDVVAFPVLKTVDPPPTTLPGKKITNVSRHGKYLDVQADDLHMVIHLARGGWLQWRDPMPSAVPRPGKGPLALRLQIESAVGFDVTEHGSQKRLALYLVRSPTDVPGIAQLGIDALDPALTPSRLSELLLRHHGQLKGALTDQSMIAGIGNAYSDEILHTARLSPFALTNRLTSDEIEILHEALCSTLSAAVSRSSGLRLAMLKAEKRSGLRVHGRTGLPCPVCGDTVRQVAYVDRSMQYCPTCQTGGKLLADRRLSRLLR